MILINAGVTVPVETLFAFEAAFVAVFDITFDYSVFNFQFSAVAGVVAFSGRFFKSIAVAAACNSVWQSFSVIGVWLSQFDLDTVFYAVKRARSAARFC